MSSKHAEAGQSPGIVKHPEFLKAIGTLEGWYWIKGLQGSPQKALYTDPGKSTGLLRIRLITTFGGMLQGLLSAATPKEAEERQGAHPFRVLLNLPRPTILWVPDMNPDMEFLGNVQNCRFWWFKACNEGYRIAECIQEGPVDPDWQSAQRLGQ